MSQGQLQTMALQRMVNQFLVMQSHRESTTPASTERICAVSSKDIKNKQDINADIEPFDLVDLQQLWNCVL